MTNREVLFSVRPAIPADTAIITSFVRQLAEFEREPLENVLLTEADVLEHGFGQNPRFEVMIAEHVGEPVGMALFFETYSTWAARPGIWIEELFVVEEFRGQGAGKLLVDAVVKLANERGCGRVELAVLDWNPARDFYARQGFFELESWRTYRLEL